MQRPWLGAALALFAAAGGAAGQSVVEPKTDSPYEMARLINRSAAQLMRDEPPDMVVLSGTWERMGAPPGDFESCPGYCRAKVFRHELDGRPGREALLKLKLRTGDSFRYVVFKRAGRGRWRMLGFVDHDFNRYEESSHRVLRAGGKSWLVVRGQEGSGSGYWLTGETWYEAGAKGLRPVLHYPVKVRVAPWPDGVGREFEARVVPARRGARALTLAYTVSYQLLGYARDEYRHLYRNRHRVAYVWDARRRAFAFNAARSDISEAEVAALADLAVEPGEGQQIGGTQFFSAGDAWKRGGYDVFLKYNLRSLLSLARKGRAEDCVWLRRVLEDCADTRERRRLEAALRQCR